VDEGNERDQLIARYLVVVEKIAGTLLRAGQNPAIQIDDLRQIGYLELIRTIDRQATGALAIEKRIARNCRTAMIRFLKTESRERRYVQQGRRKAIRDTRAAFGRPFRDDVLQEAAEEFSYPDWLRGSASVRRITHADVWEELQSCNLPEELAEIAHGVGYPPKHIPERDWRYCARPVLECLKWTPRR
jgi:hypothetical protein